jgi:hypothetical protein
MLGLCSGHVGLEAAEPEKAGPGARNAVKGEATVRPFVKAFLVGHAVWFSTRATAL